MILLIFHYPYSILIDLRYKSIYVNALVRNNMQSIFVFFFCISFTAARSHEKFQPLSDTSRMLGISMRKFIIDTSFILLCTLYEEIFFFYLC